MLLYRILTSILVFFGLHFIFDAIRNKGTLKATQWMKVSKPLLNTRKELLTGKKTSRVDRFKADAEEALWLSNTKLTWEQFEIGVVLFAVAGIILGIILNNIILSFVLGGMMAYIPIIILKMKQYKYSIYLNDQLQSALNTITTAYLKNDDINIAVKGNLHRIEEPLNIVFREFVASNMFIDSDIVKNIRSMRDRIDNHFFHEWCDSLILCQNDRNVKYVLPTIIEEMSDIKNMQEEANTMMFQIYKEFGLVAGVVLANIPFMNILNRDWFSYLTQTMPGKIIVLLTFVVTFVSLRYVIKVNKPLGDL